MVGLSEAIGKIGITGDEASDLYGVIQKSKQWMRLLVNYVWGDFSYEEWLDSDVPADGCHNQRYVWVPYSDESPMQYGPLLDRLCGAGKWRIAYSDYYELGHKEFPDKLSDTVFGLLGESDGD